MSNSAGVPGDARAPRSVTVADVALAAGVSPSTVSYVITGKRPISAPTRRRVLESIRTLGYQRPGSPGSPSGPRVGVIAVAVPRRGDPGTGTGAEFIAGAVEAARAHRLDLLLLTQDTGGDHLHRVFHAALADAAIVLDAEADDPRVPPLLASRVPAVLVGGRPGDHPGLAYLGFDHAAAGSTCVTHLAGLGHRSIVHFGRRTTAFTEGLEAAAARCGVRVAAHRGELSAEETDQAIGRLLAEAAPTGLVVDDEPALPLVLAALARRGLGVPGDLSVVAVCSETTAGAQRIPLTAVVVPGRLLGGRAVERVVAQSGVLTAASVELLAPALITGASTAPVARW